jgi:YHS domain-containing protein
MRIRNLVMILAIAIMVALVALGGCKKKEEPAPPPPAEPNAAMAAIAEAASEVEQTMCPVMDGMKIDKNVFVEYKGKKVYFCCADCKAKFEADPEKYVANLPQFAK